MSGHQYAILEDTVYFWFASNDTSGSGGDGATPLFDVREAGAAAGAIPLLSGTPTLLSHANYPAGCHEIAVAATAANGFADNDVFAVFCTLLVDAQNPSGFVGSCSLKPCPSNIREYLSTDVTGELLTSEDVGLVHESTIGTVTSQTEYILDVAFSLNTLWVGNTVTIHDESTGEMFTTWIASAVASTNTIVVAAAPPFTVTAATPDKVRIKENQHPRYAINQYAPSTVTGLDAALATIRGYFRILFRSDAGVTTDQSTEITDINADDGAGAGDFDHTLNSVEALTTVPAAIKVTTDKLVFTVANQVDANIQSINDANVVGDGTAGSLWRDV